MHFTVLQSKQRNERGKAEDFRSHRPQQDQATRHASPCLKVSIWCRYRFVGLGGDRFTRHAPQPPLCVAPSLGPRERACPRVPPSVPPPDDHKQFRRKSRAPLQSTPLAHPLEYPSRAPLEYPSRAPLEYPSRGHTPRAPPSPSPQSTTSQRAAPPPAPWRPRRAPG